MVNHGDNKFQVPLNFERFGLIVKGPAFRQESVTGP